MNKNLFIIFTLFLIGYVFPQTYNPSNLKFTIAIDKNSYLVDEAIYIEFAVKNISNESTYFSYPFRKGTGYFDYKVLDENSKELPGLRLHFEKADVEVAYYLLPGEIVYFVDNILNDYGDKDENHLYSHFINPGNYYIQAEYCPAEIKVAEHNKVLASLVNDKDAFIKYVTNNKVNFVSSDTLVSEKLCFEVIEPSGKEIEARDTWIQYYSFFQKKKYHNDTEKIKKNWSNFIKDYPNSSYIKNVVIWISNWDEYDFDYSLIYEKYKNSIYSYELISKNRQSFLPENKLSKEVDIKSLSPEIIQNNILNYNNKHFKNNKLSDYTENKYILRNELEKRVVNLSK